MKKIVYTRKKDGGVSIVVPSPKERIERILGPLTDKEYEDHVRERSIPDDAINVRALDDEDIPTTREFRDAWADVTEESRVDIDVDKAKDIALTQIRRKRDKELDNTDKLMVRAIEEDKKSEINRLKTVRKALRDKTEPVKALDTKGKINDEALLQQLREEMEK